MAMGIRIREKFYSSEVIMILFSLITIISCYQLQAQNNQIELKEGFFYINNEKFFIKGIGYEVGAIPGQLPWEREFDEELLAFDMNRILSAGFNTIRTWAAFTDEELQVISSFDIKIIMGIWIDPHGDFNDPAFITSAIEELNNVLSYSKNYQNIIAYLIMNEPLPETIFLAGYNNTIQLWTQLIDIIHDQHPGIPATIANTCNGTYIDSETFDFSAYNVYPYNPSTVNHSHEYPAFVEYLSGLRDDSMPLIITEYGLSVSPSGPGNWGYGGNSIQEQLEGIMYMYRSIIDGGATGSCVFNYSDGWWKGGNEFQHDDNAEEWFGLIEYQDLNDKYGIPRPVWDVVKTYLSAVLVSPKNSVIYLNRAPLEVFCNDTVKKIEIYESAELVYSSDISENYLIDTINIQLAGIEDHVWDFIFFNDLNNVVKEEQITFLCSDAEVELPWIEITTEPEIFEEPGTIKATYSISEYQDFTHSDYINYVFYPHIGWSFGSTYSKSYPQSQTNFEFSNYHSFGDDAYVITFAAGFDIYFNNFSKRIYNQITLPVGNSLGVYDESILSTNKSFKIFPNPANDYFIIESIEQSNTTFCYQIFDLSGKLIVSENTQIDIQNDICFLQPGLYIVEIFDLNGQNFDDLKLIKNPK